MWGPILLNPVHFQQSGLCPEAGMGRRGNQVDATSTGAWAGESSHGKGSLR